MANDEGPCLTGKMVWAMIQFGYLNDQRTQKAIAWLTRHARCDDSSDADPAGYPYVSNSKKPKGCWGRHTCYRNVFWRLKALGAIPEAGRTEEIKKRIADAAGFILRHRVYRRSHNFNELINAEWMNFVFPSLGELDVLQVLETLTSLGYKDERMNDAIQYVQSRQNDAGHWTIDKTLNGRIRAKTEEAGSQSKWITYRALKTLKKWNGLS